MKALVVGTGGVGQAVSEALRARGDDVATLSRREDGLDITDEDSVIAAIGSVVGPFDLIFVATGILMPDGRSPEKAIKEVDPEALAGTFAVNAIGPMLILKHVLPHLPKDRRAVFAALSARVGSIGDNGIGGWHSYRASKTGLNQLIHGAAIELKRTHKQAIAVCLHPGTVETPFTEDYKGHRKVTASEAAANLIAVMDGLTVEQSGGFYDYAGKEIPW